MRFGIGTGGGFGLQVFDVRAAHAATDARNRVGLERLARTSVGTLVRVYRAVRQHGERLTARLFGMGIAAVHVASFGREVVMHKVLLGIAALPIGLMAWSTDDQNMSSSVGQSNVSDVIHFQNLATEELVLSDPAIGSIPQPLAFAGPSAFDAMEQEESIWASGRRAGDTFEVDSLKMTFAYVPAGTFMMGSPENERNRDRTDESQVPVKITEPFYLGTHEVTVGQFRQFVEATGYVTAAESGRGLYLGKGARIFVGTEWKWVLAANWREPGFRQTDDQPVTCVNYYDAEAFVNWLNDEAGVTDREYRLPTEAQWEYACRAGTTTAYWFGPDDKELAQVANVADATAKSWFADRKAIASDDGHIYTSPVGSYRANQWGLYDMQGNVIEWCQDWYCHRLPGGRDPVISDARAYRVIRGSHWRSRAASCRSAARYKWTSSNRSCLVGFRVAAVHSY